MARFQEMGLALAKNTIGQLDKQMKDNKLRVELENQPLQAEKTQMQMVENDMKHSEMVEKLKMDLAKQAAKAEGAQGAGPVAIGGNLIDTFSPPVQEEAQGLPMLDEMNQGLPA